jgi:hypothetical protein
VSTSFLNQAESRRRFLQMGAAGAVAGLLTGGLELALPPAVRAQSALTPDAALAELMAGNQRFITGRMTSNEHDLAYLSNSSSIRLSAIFLLHGLREISSPRKSLPALNMARRCWGPR